jgi:signal transduction histidine kinase
MIEAKSPSVVILVCLLALGIFSVRSSRLVVGWRLGRWTRRISVLLFLSSLNFLVAPTGSAQIPAKKNVFVLNQVGVSHTLTNVVSQELLNGVRDTPSRHVEFYSESFDMLSFPDRLTPQDLSESILKQYGSQKFDVVVAVGPDTIRFLMTYAKSLFPDVPVVICGSSADQAGQPTLDSTFTGTWLQLEPRKTLEVALRLFPGTRHVFVVGGASAFDRTAMSLTKDSVGSLATNTEIAYLTDMAMGELLEKLHNLPDHSVVLYVSFFQDSAGNKFLNATKALPMVASAADGPVFGLSDMYLGHGIVGGDLMGYQQQGKVTARIVSELLDGKRVEEIPVETLAGVYMFDWNELTRWRIPESKLPPSSVVLFRVPSLWDRTKWLWATAFLVILGLSVLAIYLQHSRKRLVLAEERQRNLSGMLINLGETERSRIASELHDDFSQRLAVIALKLDNVAETVSPLSKEADGQIHQIVDSVTDVGTDLHTLSHRLHSSTLQSLGLVPALSALCKEFTAQQGVEVEFAADGAPRSVHPESALCIFRIVQEGLRNLKRYSGAQRGLVSLRVDDGKLRVCVLDHGCGFDLEKLRHDQGIGIRSMKERASFLGGEFEIQSAPGQGTTVNAWVPLTPDGLWPEDSGPLSERQ